MSTHSDRSVTHYRNVRVRREGEHAGRYPWRSWDSQREADAERDALIAEGVPADEIERETRTMIFGEWKRAF